jgi:uncharacterized protein (UPF0333 family)
MKRIAQISTEYLIIVGFVVFLVIMLLGISLSYSSGSQDRIRSSTMEQFSNTIITNAEEVYYAGAPSKRVLTAYMPTGVESVVIDTIGITFNISSNSGTNVIFYPSKVPLAGALSFQGGVKRITLEAQPSRVFISEG